MIFRPSAWLVGGGSHGGRCHSMSGAARDDDFSPCGMAGDRRLERRTMPKIERIDRLHVVMTVEQHMRSPFAVSLAVGLGDDGGMTGRRPDFGRKAKRRNIFRKMIGRR